MPTYEIEFESGGKTMVLEVEGVRPPTEEESHGLIRQQLSNAGPEMLPTPPPQEAGPTLGAEALNAPPTTETAPQVPESILQGVPTAPQEAPAQPPETSVGPMAFGAVQGVTDIVGGIPDVLRAGAEFGLSQLPTAIEQPLRAMTVGEDVPPGTPSMSKQLQQQSKRLLQKVGVPPEDLNPDTRTEQFIQRVVREVTGTMVGLPAIRAISAGARAIPLGRAVAGEALMGTAQGAGAATAQQVAPGNLPAEIAGQLAPNVLGLTRALARNVGFRLVPDPEALRRQVAASLSEFGGDLDQAGQNVAEAVGIQGRVPGFQPTLPEATRAPSLISLQRSQRANDPLLAGRLTERRNQNIDAITNTLDEMFPGGDIADAQRGLRQTQQRVQGRLAGRSETARQRVQQIQQTTEQRNRVAQARINERVTRSQGEIRNQTANLVERGDVGALEAQELASVKARSLYEQARQTFRGESRRLYEEVDPENAITGQVGDLYDQADFISRQGLLSFDQRDLPISLRDFERSIKARASQVSRPVTPAAIGDEFDVSTQNQTTTALGDPIDEAYLAADGVPADSVKLRDTDVSLNDLQRLRSHVLRDARSQTGPDAGNKRRLLNQFRQAVESRMEGLAREQGRPDTLERLQNANDFYRQNISKFSTGAGERILRQTNGVYRTSNAQVIREFLKTPEDATQFVQGIGNRQDALEAMESYLDAELYLKAVNTNTGRISTTQAQRFLRERNPMLRLFPELRDRYNNINALELKTQRVEDAAKRLSQRSTRRVSESEELLDAQERAARTEASVQRQEQRLAREPGQAILQNTLDNGGIAQIMGRNDANSQLIRLSDTLRDNPEARQSIPRAMWQEFLRREGQRAGRDPITDNPLINDRQLDNFVNRYSGTLNHIYGAEHVSNLRQVARGLRLSRAADRAPVQMGSPTTELLRGQSSFARQAAQTAVPVSMPIASLKLRLIRFAGRQAYNFIQDKKEEAIQAITAEMLYDPDISKTFAMLRNAKTAKSAGFRLKAHALMLGAENRFDDPEDD